MVDWLAVAGLAQAIWVWALGGWHEGRQPGEQAARRIPSDAVVLRMRFISVVGMRFEGLGFI